MFVKIISDGNPLTTRIIDKTTGTPIKGVVSVDWHLSADSLGEARLMVLRPEVELSAAAVVEEVSLLDRFKRLQKASAVLYDSAHWTTATLDDDRQFALWYELECALKGCAAGLIALENMQQEERKDG